LENNITTALVTNILDYSNFPFHNIVLKDITKVQRVQNSLALVVTSSPRCILSVPKSLRLLPGKYRIFLRYVVLFTRNFHVNNHLISIHCLLYKTIYPASII